MSTKRPRRFWALIMLASVFVCGLTLRIQFDQFIVFIEMFSDCSIGSCDNSVDVVGKLMSIVMILLFVCCGSPIVFSFALFKFFRPGGNAEDEIEP